MAIARTIDWRLTISPEEADSRLRTAFDAVGLNPEGGIGHVSGKSKTNILKDRWSANVTADIKPYQSGSIVELRVEMPAGTKHYAVASDIAKAVGEDAFDDRGLKAAVDRLSRISKVGGWLELRNVRHYLTASETVQELGQGVWGNRQGLVILTDERLWFFDKALIGATVEEFPLTEITSISVSKKIGGEALAITVAGNVTTISRMMHGQGDALIRAYRQLKASATAASVAPTAMHQASSDADAIVKLADLHEAGIITDEEFASKKSEILARM